ncbi:uncharacterized protein SPPG_05549 [Spizellomyces punctatus DAOM BR117]|uniref:adenosine deaminase n=1 Tax=Spizellomyces punctatus (strain DAOM BR117) TaxID=645134 RepID=A0A0L0HCP0_SPIPD|nr:uncharacterized protein SPPG_05549 [Spizellomyces punctatus DAOM BR117]KNC99295.1 hypothetical protein SPPG_05549 [Spizellomyces punctatus DAOM BR117]|eukprot:XP_016607335.1 hypothetical protein SPPG_05549 [Spizellomyces punctatus DAOM BR117]
MAPIYRILAYFTFLIAPVIAAPIARSPDPTYTVQRNQLVLYDSANRFDNDIVLSDMDKKANAYLHALREKETTALKAQSQFPPALHFSLAKPVIDSTELFKVIRSMPKGGFLHGHLEAMLDIKWIVKTAAEDIGNCYLKFVNRVYPTFDERGNASIQLPLFNFSSTQLPRDEWASCQHARSSFPGGPSAFDAFVEHQNSVISNEYPTEEKAWAKFDLVFDTLGSLIQYQPMFEAYITRLLEQYHNDGLTYIELRSSRWETYHLDGTRRNFSSVLDSVRDIVDKFRKDHPHFQDLRFIYQDLRFNPTVDIENSLMHAIELRKTHGDQIIGYDLVGHEETSALRPLVDTLRKAQASASEQSTSLPFIFHAGETTRSGVPPDTNLYDAYLLNTKRVGHAFSLSHHPGLIEKFINSDIAVEVAPISNQLLGYIGDLRGHPMIDLLLKGVQVSLASDDPGVFGYEGVSYDYYQVYMAFESLDLASLKKLASNGITYAGMGQQEKAEAMVKFETLWDRWILSLVDR